MLDTAKLLLKSGIYVFTLHTEYKFRHGAEIDCATVIFSDEHDIKKSLDTHARQLGIENPQASNDNSEISRLEISKSMTLVMCRAKIGFVESKK